MIFDHHAHRSARILLVDDQEVNVRLLEAVLAQAGYTDVARLTDSREVVPQVLASEPDIILLDLMMPYMDGFEVLEKLRAVLRPDSFLPVLVLTADVSQQSRTLALERGANDFVTKPFDRQEVLLRVSNLLQMRSLYRQLNEHNRRLDEQVRARTQELEAAQVEMLERLAWAAEYRDDETGRHTRRVGHNAATLARALELDPNLVVLVARAAPLHDVGKIGVPDSILRKRGKLTPDEFAIIKTHTTIGGRILANGSSALVRLAASIAMTHHERWDGDGYPAGLRAEQIPIEGRIVAITDAFDAMTHKRPYKEAMPVQAALEEIRSQVGRQFDPRVAEVFLACSGGMEL